MPDITPAIPALLQTFDARLVREAEQLVEDNAVIALDDIDGVLEAEIQLDDKSAYVRWKWTEEGWKGTTEVTGEVVPLVLCSTLVAWHKQARLEEEPEAPESDEVDEQTFQSLIERRVARTLTPEELGYLAKLDKRFQRVVQADGEIFDQDLVRLHPKWNIESLEPVPLWPEPPTSVREFWDYIALAFHEKKLAIPSFLRGVADLEKTEARLHDWRRERSVPVWRNRIQQFNIHQTRESPDGELKRRVCQFRLMVTVTEARLQILYPETDEFSPVVGNELPRLKKDHARGRLKLDATDELLLLSCLCQRPGDEQRMDGFRLDEKDHARWLGSLLLQPALQDKIVTLDGIPVQRSASPLKWVGTEDASANTLTLHLETTDGQPAPLPLRILPGQQTFFLSADWVFPGPPWLGDDSQITEDIVIPMEAFAFSDGIRFLEELGIPLPDPIAARVSHETLSVQVRAHCLAKSPIGGADYAMFCIEASDKSGRVCETLRNSGWEPLPNDAATDNRIICRDRTALIETGPLLEGFRATYDADHGGFRVRLTKQFPDKFQEWAAGLPESVALLNDERLGSILADPLIARVRLEAAQTNSIDWFDLKMIFDIEGADLKPAEIRRLMAARGGYVQLADGTWRRVKLELSEEQQALLDQLGIDLNEASDKDAHRLHWRQLAKEEAAALIKPDAWRSITERMDQALIDEKPPVPKDLSVTLRPYQDEGFHFLAYLTLNKFGGILADDMGLGKTIQSIAWILWLRERDVAAKKNKERAAPTLVICPKSVLDVWGQEFRKAAPSLTVQVLRDKDELDLDFLRNFTDVLVMNYAQLRGCIEQLEAVHFLAVILDEGQQIKNPDSKAARAARKVQAQNRLVLTGTPLENRLLDLWSLMTFATPGALGDRAYFQRHFDRRKDERAASRLSARLRPFLLRRTKSQVARDLPSRTEENLICEMSDKQARLYQEELARAQQMVISASGFEVLRKQRFAVLQALTRLRQVCCHPSLIKSETDKDKGVDSAKLTATLELIEQLHDEGHKVLLFSQFVTMLTIIRERVEAMGIPIHWLTGSTQDRASVVQAFQEDENASVFLLSLKAGGSGLNLTAASYVILYDPWWNPAVEAQAIDRAHRIGQTQPVIAYRMITKGTIEEKIMLLQEKKNLMSANILGDQSFSSTLDRTDFEFLFDIEANHAAEEAERKAEKDF